MASDPIASPSPLDQSHSTRHEECKAFLWQLGFMGQGCKVGVIDTGVDLEWLRKNGDPAQYTSVHPLDFTPASEGPGDFAPGLHGTRIVRDILLGAPRAEIFSLKVYGVRHSPSRRDLAAALEWCSQSGLSVVNISTAIYGGDCSIESPCLLCRSINTHALAAGLFTVSVGGDAYTLNEMIARGEAPVICPANCVLGWAVEGPGVGGDRRLQLEAFSRNRRRPLLHHRAVYRRRRLAPFRRPRPRHLLPAQRHSPHFDPARASPHRQSRRRTSLFLPRRPLRRSLGRPVVPVQKRQNLRKPERSVGPRQRPRRRRRLRTARLDRRNPHPTRPMGPGRGRRRRSGHRHRALGRSARPRDGRTRLGVVSRIPRTNRSRRRPLPTVRGPV